MRFGVTRSGRLVEKRGFVPQDDELEVDATFRVAAAPRPGLPFAAPNLSKLSSLFMFFPAAVMRTSVFTFSSPRSLTLSMPCRCLAPANIGSIQASLFLLAFS